MSLCLVHVGLPGTHWTVVDVTAQAMRTLSWKHTLGLVTMDVELADRTLSVAVTPVQAVILLYFQDQGESLEPHLVCLEYTMLGLVLGTAV